MANTPYTDGYRAGQEYERKAITKRLQTYLDELTAIETKNFVEAGNLLIRMRAIATVIEIIKDRAK